MMDYEDRHMDIDEEPPCRPAILRSGIPVLELNDLDMLDNDTRSIISDGGDAELEWEAPDIFIEGKPVPRRLIRSQNSNPVRPKTADIMRELRENHVISSQKSTVTMTSWESCDRGAVFAHKPPYHLDQLDFEMEKRKLSEGTGRNDSRYNLPPVSVKNHGIEPWWKRTQDNKVSHSESDHVRCSSPRRHQVQAVASEPSCDDSIKSVHSRKKGIKQNKNRSGKDPVIVTDTSQYDVEGQTNIRITIEQKKPDISSKTGNKSPEILLQAKDALEDLKLIKSRSEITDKSTNLQKYKKQSNKKKKQRKSRDAGTEQ